MLLNMFASKWKTHTPNKLYKDKTYFLFRAPLDYAQNTTDVIWEPDAKGNETPLDLSMDWLNNHLYILFQVNQTVS